MSDSGFGKVAEPASEMIITPLDSTWDQAVYNLNHRPHPAFATDTDDEDDDENEGGDQDQVGGPSVASLERGGDSCPASSRARWDYWTPEERRQPHPGLVRKVSVMREDCELLSREEEGETGDLSDGEHYQVSQWRQDCLHIPDEQPTEHAPRSSRLFLDTQRHRL